MITTLINTKRNDTMKTRTIALASAILLIACTAIAVGILKFSSWSDLEKYSPNIILARCVTTPDPYNVVKNGVHIDMTDGLIETDVHIVSTLKGATNSDNAVLDSRYWPRQGEYYLIFAIYHDGIYQAVEPYRIVPLGPNFPSNAFAGKLLHEKIQIALKYRLDMLNEQIQKEQEEKQRLQQGLQQE